MKEKALELYRSMVGIRIFEELAIGFYKKGLVGGSYHSSVGQEAVAAGVCAALGREDTITTTYRGRGQHLAKGADPVKLFAEVLGRTDGFCKGKGGPMHIADRASGILGANGIVGAGVPIASGSALAAKMAGNGRVAATFFGDGAMNQGALMETLNLAALWDLPLLLVCENNLYAEMTPLDESVKNQNLAQRAAAFGMDAAQVDGNDVGAVHEAAASAVGRMRRGGGPIFLEMMTYRLHGHMHGDKESYRSKEEVAEWRRERDPIPYWKNEILSRKWAELDALDALETAVREELEQAADEAAKSEEPDAEEITTDVYQ